MIATPRSFQADAIQHHIKLLKSAGASAEASVPGFGKTFVAAFIAREMGHELVVCCPKVVIPHWRAAAEMVGAKVRCIANYEQFKPTRQAKRDAAGKVVKDAEGRTIMEAQRIGNTGMGQWEIMNKRWRWTFPKPSLLVFDEAHLLKTRTSQNAKLATAAKRQEIPTLVMSATLAVDPTDLYAVGYLLGLHSGDSMDFKFWQMRYGVLPIGFDFKFCPVSDPTALSRLHAELFPKRGHRKTYDEIPGFPKATTDVRQVSADPGALARIATAWERANELEQLHEEALTAATARLRARQLAELAKVPAIVDLARDLISSGLSVPIFVNFHDTIDHLTKELGFRAIDGRVGDGARDEAIARFQADQDRGLILQTQSGGVGISLHDTRGHYPRHSILSPGENARDFVQALGRNRRDGQKSPAFRTVLTLADSVESKVYRALSRKADQIDTINDGVVTDADLNPLS